MSIFSENLFERVLFEPVNNGANKLFIVSGYATANMAIRHFEYAKTQKKTIEINLIAGMYIQDGILKNNHISFKELHNGRDGVIFNCNYINSIPPVHSKVYSWFKDEIPVAGFIGSANYTQNAFSNSMREVLSQIDASECKQYYDKLLGDSLTCIDPNVEKYISFYEKKQRETRDTEETSEADIDDSLRIDGLEMVTLSLVDKDGEVPSRSGLNWGQREGREPNQAYINIPAPLGRTNFFPERYVVFTVLTDDEKQLICVRAQDGGKGLHSTLNNSHLGEYFRNRLGLANGSFVSRKDLLKYGRTDVDFYKIDDETYYLDFSVKG